MQTSELDYHLPEELIATRPAEPRDASRLMVLRRSDLAAVEHRAFRDLPDYLTPGDSLVFNRSAVVPARLLGRKRPSGGRVEGLFVRELAPGRWSVLLKSNGRLRTDTVVELVGPDGQPTPVALRLAERDGDGWLADVERDAGADRRPASEILDAVGATPLPPYILARRQALHETIADAFDRRTYQTVYADPARSGSIAAPTAGLHFTPELLGALDTAGVRAGWVVLHVGEGTFKPITAERVEDHAMHAERFEVPPDTRLLLAETSGRRVAVGTTTVRALESIAGLDADAAPADTRLFIQPGHEFRHVDALITNFHLPRSTLLTLVAALLPEGLPRLLEHYRDAVERGYRFYSYGDAMLVLP